MLHIISERTIDLFRQGKIFSTLSGEQRFRVGDTIEFDDRASLEPYSAVLGGHTFIEMGAFSYSWSPFPAGLQKIGRYCSIAGGLRIPGGNHTVDFVSSSSFSHDREFSIFVECMKDEGVDFPRRYSPRYQSSDRLAGPVIGHDVWIGDNVTLSRAITLGTGCVVAAGSMVTKSVPPYAIVGGNPARIIRMRFDEGIVRDLLALEWWRFKFTDFAAMRIDAPSLFIDELAARIAAHEIEEYRPAPLSLASLEEPQ